MIPGWLKRLICWWVGHRGVRVVTRAILMDVGLLGVGFKVEEARWDCTRCGQRGYRMEGMEL